MAHHGNLAIPDSVNLILLVQIFMETVEDPTTERQGFNQRKK
ncbi:hypothetical protein [Klebsiella aerogenes]